MINFQCSYSATEFIILRAKQSLTIFLLTDLQPMLDVPIYGRIATLELFRPPVSKQTLMVFVRRESYDCCLKGVSGSLLTHLLWISSASKECSNKTPPACMLEMVT